MEKQILKPLKQTLTEFDIDMNGGFIRTVYVCPKCNTEVDLPICTCGAHLDLTELPGVFDIYTCLNNMLSLIDRKEQKQFLTREIKRLSYMKEKYWMLTAQGKTIGKAFEEGLIIVASWVSEVFTPVTYDELLTFYQNKL
jgi:hypothetical protein